MAKPMRLVNVVTFGCWDLLHVGHLRFLNQAKVLNSSLIVGVPNDKVVEEDKGKPPIIPFEHRFEMVMSLKVVNQVIAYRTLDFISVLKRCEPVDILAVGEFWGKEERHIRAEDYVTSRGGVVKKIPYYKLTSTTKIKEKIVKESTK